jgi:hypothetical protein
LANIFLRSCVPGTVRRNISTVGGLPLWRLRGVSPSMFSVELPAKVSITCPWEKSVRIWEEEVLVVATGAAGADAAVSPDCTACGRTWNRIG